MYVNLHIIIHVNLILIMNIMIKDKVISISDLRTNATKIINNLPKTGDKYIFVHNKPRAVLVDIDWFEAVSSKFDRHWIEYFKPDESELNAIKEYETKKQKWKLEFENAFNFLDSLK